jgi:hypothetical protein
MLRIPHCLDSRLTDGGKVVRRNYQGKVAPAFQELSITPNKVLCGSVDIAPPFVISALNERKWLVSRPGCLTPIERARPLPTG